VLAAAGQRSQETKAISEELTRFVASARGLIAA